MTVSIPFGWYAGAPIDRVPTSYLSWLIRECKLSSGLRKAVADELGRRGLTPPPDQPRPVPQCPRCDPLAGWLAAHERDSLGRPRLRATCAGCGCWLKFLPLTPENLALRANG
jgi:hypothetical protein